MSLSRFRALERTQRRFNRLAHRYARQLDAYHSQAYTRKHRAVRVRLAAAS